MEIYNRTTSQIITEQEFRNEHESVAFPSQLTRDILLQYNCDVVLQSPQPVPNEFEFVVRDSVETDFLGNTVQKWIKIDRYPTQESKDAYLAEKLSTLKTEMKLMVEKIREGKEKEGTNFTFSDTIVGRIQTRNEIDIRNIQAVTTSGIVLQASGVTDNVIQFRDESDIIHILTPTEAIALGMAVQVFISDTYTYMWDKKAQIDSCVTIQELNNINLND